LRGITKRPVTLLHHHATQANNLFNKTHTIAMQTEVMEAKVIDYNNIFNEQDYNKRAGEGGAQKATNNFYTLVTEFYEKGWGQSFHFAPRYKGESFAASIIRHEHFLAIKLGLCATDRVLDVGCGVMGPARNLAHISGAHITGITINEHQIQRCKALNQASTVSHLLDVKQGDFMAMPFADNTFDKMYAIEATCHAPSMVGIYKQVISKLKPGGKACFYEWAMTDKYDPNNPQHVQIKKDIEYGNGICELSTTAQIDQAIAEAGFIKEETIDLVHTNYGNNVPWYVTLQSGWSLAQMRHTKAFRTFTQYMLNTLEALRIVLKGTAEAHRILIIAANSLPAGGKLQIFTPMYLVCVRKPA